MLDYESKRPGHPRPRLLPPLFEFLMLPATLVILGLYWLPVLMFCATGLILVTEGAEHIRFSQQHKMIRGALIDPMPGVLIGVIALNAVRCIWYTLNSRSILIALLALLHLAATAMVPLVANLCWRMVISK